MAKLAIAVIGSIGSGKSTVADYFRQLGIDVISADTIARQIVEKGMPAYLAIKDYFGEAVLTSNGHLDRKKLRQLIFDNPSQKQWLEQLLHPIIKQEIVIEKQLIHGPYCIIEIPLLKSLDDYPMISRILWVKSNRENQIARVVKRDNTSDDEIEKIIATQPTEEHCKKIATDTIENNSDLQALQQKVLKLHQKYIGLD